MHYPHDTDPTKPVVVLFRHDPRLGDNKALSAAVSTGKPVVAAFVLEEESGSARPLGGARRWWLHHSLEALIEALKDKGLALVLRRGAMAATAGRLAADTGADMVLWNRRYDPPGIEADKAMKADLTDRGIHCDSFDGHLLHEPWRLKTASGGHYRVYTPFRRALAALGEPPAPLPVPKSLRAFEARVDGDALDDWALLPTRPDWAGGLRARWTPGEAGARKRLDAFLHGALSGYAEKRDLPGTDSTSRLSPHLAHGEITPRQIFHALASREFEASARDAEKFRAEIAWREFSWHLLFHNPDLGSRNFNARFDAFAWRSDAAGLKRWQRGGTGYPLVDAGMRELWQTGWMHNRVRMVVASFLIKHLLIDWREGEKWFRDTLVDADPANNTASWQWVAGSGADAAPYFRIFNPILQGEKFDPDGAYVRAFVPEIAGIPDKYLHKPSDAPEDVLREAGVKLGDDYPVAIVEHSGARQRALRAFDAIKDNA